MSDEHVVPEIDLDEVKRGDIVIGVLPVHIVAEVNVRGARYFHLVLDLPLTARGRELSAEEMRSFGCRLAEYTALPVGRLHSPAERERLQLESSDLATDRFLL